MKKATWNDIELCLNHGTLEEQDQETLEAFSRVEALSSSNPRYHVRFQNAQDRIRRRLDRYYADDRHAEESSRKESGKDGHDKWWKKVVVPVGVSVAAGLLVAICKMLWPYLFR